MLHEGIPIRITFQNSTFVAFEVVNTFGATLTSMFTLYNSGLFGQEECMEENGVQYLSTVDKYLARCMGDEPHTYVKIFIEDGEGGILKSGDHARVPKCCHQSQASQELDLPIAMYLFKLSCVNPCTVVGTMEQ